MSEAGGGRFCAWRGWGHALGRLSVPNSELERRFGLEAGWVERRTGFAARRYAAADQATSDLAVEAGRMALARGGVSAEELGLVLLATSTPDHLLPGAAPAVAARLGSVAPAMDLMAACSGFVYGLMVADAWVKGTGQAVLLIGANVLSRRVNPLDLQTACLFGDAAGAVVLAPSGTAGILATAGRSAGEHAAELMIAAGGSRQPWGPEVSEGDRYMRMPSGGRVFKLAVESMEADCVQVLASAGLTVAEIDWMVPHQASFRIVRELGERLGVAESRRAWWLGELGNSSAATVPVAMSLGREAGLLESGQRLLLSAAGAGFCSAAAVVQV